MMLLAVILAAATTMPHDPRCDSIKTDDLIACAQAEYDAADKALNTQWKKALATVKASGADTPGAKAGNGNFTSLQALVAAQRTWLAYRDAECRFQIYDNAGGRELPIYRLGCLSELTRNRTKQLRDDFTEGR